MHHANHRPSAIVERDQNSPMQLPDNERARAIDRIDNPCKPVCAGRVTMLFAEDSMAGIDALNLVADRLLRRTIGERHRIVAASDSLVLDRESHPKMRQDCASREVREM